MMWLNRRMFRKVFQRAATPQARRAVRLQLLTLDERALPNVAPVANPVGLAAHAGTGGYAASDASDADSDPLTITVGAATYGSASTDGYNLFYTPTSPTFVGTDSFTYTVDDGNGGTSSATVTVTVSNAAPTALDVYLTVPAEGSLGSAPNATDGDGDSLATTVGAASHGTASTDGYSIFYAPTGTYLGTDSFTYSVDDGHGGTSSATVHVTVVPQVSVLSSTSAGEGGTAGSFVLTRTGDTSGTLSVGYTVGGTATSGTDYAALSGTAVFGVGQGSVTVTVTPVDDAAIESPDETVDIALAADPGYLVYSGAGSVSIQDDDGPPLITAVMSGASGYPTVYTADDTLVLSGEAPLNTTVIVYRGGAEVGRVNTDAFGTWSFDYTGTVLAEGTYAFRAATVPVALGASPTVVPLPQAFSGYVYVLVDQTAPTVTVDAPATTYALAPVVHVTIGDRAGISPTAGLYVEVLDATSAVVGSTYASASNYAADVVLPTLPATGSYTVRVTVADYAGNSGTGTAALAAAAHTTYEVAAADRTYDPLAVLTVSHALDLDESAGGGTASLVYSTGAVDPRPVVQAELQTPNDVALPATARVTLTWDGVPQAYDDYSLSAFAPGDLITLTARAASAQATGRHEWSIEVSFPGTALASVAASGVTYVVDHTDSPYGAGWAFGGSARLVHVAASGALPAGELLAYADGTSDFFAEDGSGGYMRPAGVFGTLATAGGGGWTFTAPGGHVSTYNGDGMLVQRLSADGMEAETLTYTDADSDGDADDVDTYTAVDGTVSTFNYTGGQLTSISTASTAGRTVNLAYSGTDLVQIEDADGRFRGFSYGSNPHLLTQDVAGDPFDPGDDFVLPTDYFYDADGFLAGSFSGDDSDKVYRPYASPSAALGDAVKGRVVGRAGDGAGGTTAADVDEKGRVVASWDATGRKTTFVRDADGLVTAMTDPLGRTTSYTYDSDGYLLTITYPSADGVAASTTETMVYNTAFHTLQSYTDRRGKTTGYTYDGSGRLLSGTDPTGVTRTYTYYADTDPYNRGGLVYEVKNDAGTVVRTYDYDALRRKVRTDAPTEGTYETWTYDNQGNVASYTDAEFNTTTYTNDDLGRVLHAYTPVSGVDTAYEYDNAGLLVATTDPNGVVTRHRYDSRGNLVETVMAEGTADEASVQYEYDLADRQVRSHRDGGPWQWTAYDPAGRMVGQGTAAAAFSQGVRTFAAYDDAGQLVRTVDANGNATDFEYDGLGRMVVDTDATGAEVRTTFDDADRPTLVEQTTTSGTRTLATVDYDDAGREILRADGAGGMTSTSYDSEGRVDEVMDPVGRITKYAYDDLNRVVAVTDGYGTGSARTRYTTYTDNGQVATQTDGLNTITFTYDALGRLETVTDGAGGVTTYGYDDAGNLVAATDDATGTTTYSYDGLDRRVGTLDANGNTTATGYDDAGRVWKQTDGENHTTEYLYDELGRLWKTVAPDGGVTETRYDAAGNATLLVDPVGNQTRWAYDELNRVVAEVDPAGQVATTAYDAEGRIVTVTDRLGRILVYAYDDADRVTGVEWWTASYGSLVDTRTYTYFDDGQVETAANAAGTYTFTYDDLGRLATAEDPHGVVLTYSYNAADDVVETTDSLGADVTSTYDGAHRLTSRVDYGPDKLRVEFDYGGRGPLPTEVRRYSDQTNTTLVGTTLYAYDAGGRLTGMTHQDGAAAVLVDYGYTYDGADRLLTETRNSVTRTYAHDDNGQVTSDGTASYAYDANGNRTMSGYATGDANRLASDGVWDYAYDAAGNLASKTRISDGLYWEYAYDHNDQMTQAVEWDYLGGTLMLTVDYAYDVLGYLSARTETPAVGPAVATKYVYDVGSGDPCLWEELDGSGVVQAFYVRAESGELLARSLPSGGGVYFLTDRTGSVREITDTAGSIVKELEYDAYGNVVSETGSGNRGNLLYDGYFYDSAVGLYNAHWRWYDATIGQWTTEDPIGFGAGDVNTRRYVGNDAANGYDPSGLDEVPTVIPKKLDPIVGKNGTHFIPYEFNLSKETTAAGWIIQGVTIEFSFYNSDGLNITQTAIDKKLIDFRKIEYFEAWPVAAKSKTSSQNESNKEARETNRNRAALAALQFTAEAEKTQQGELLALAEKIKNGGWDTATDVNGHDGFPGKYMGLAKANNIAKIVMRVNLSVSFYDTPDLYDGFKAGAVPQAGVLQAISSKSDKFEGFLAWARSLNAAKKGSLPSTRTIVTTIIVATGATTVDAKDTTN